LASDAAGAAVGCCLHPHAWLEWRARMGRTAAAICALAGCCPTDPIGRSVGWRLP